MSILSRQAIEAAYPLAEAIEARGKIVVPVPGSLLQSLVNSAVGYLQYDISDAGNRSLNPNPVGLILNPEDDELKQVDELGLQMENAVHLIVDSLRNQMAFITNEASPLITDIAQNTLKAIEARNNSILRNANIVEVTYPDLMKNSAFLTLIDEFKDQVYNENIPRPAFGPRSPSELLEIMKVGANAIDKDVEAFMKQKGGEFFTKIWTEVFTDLGTRDLSDVMAQDMIDSSVAIFLMANGAQNEEVDNNRGSIRDFTTLLSYIRNRAARIASINARTFDGLKQLGTVYASAGGEDITVYDENYRSYLEQGGTIEAIIGSHVQGGRHRTITALLNNSTELVDEYRRYVAMQQTREQITRAANIRAALTDFFAEHVKGKNNYSQLVSDFVARLGTYNDRDLDDLYVVVTKLVCDTLFSHTSAKTILLYTHDVLNDNPDLDVRVARTIAIKKYLDDYRNSELMLVDNA